MNEKPLPSCPHCGAPLRADAPEGLCSNCLMALSLKTDTVFTDDTPAAKAPIPPEQLAPHFPQLEILECLGRGGMGVVYRARQRTLNRLVALKLLAPERVGDETFAARFTREAQALAALNHPNIVTIHDFGQAGGFYFLLMEFVDGLNLRQLLRTGRLAPEEALAIVPPLCDALQFAHDQGIIHRDIKPENLLLDKAGRVKVADFGIAKMLGDTEASSGSITELSAASGGGPPLTRGQAVGTPGYSAPEQKADPQRVDRRADIYSLGVVFYEMLTGELPGKRIDPPSKKVHLDVRLDEVVLRALEAMPERRYQQVSELRTQLETLATSPSALGALREPVQAEAVRAGMAREHQTAATTGKMSRPIRSARFAGLAVGLLTLAAGIVVTLQLPDAYAAETKVSLRRLVPAAINVPVLTGTATSDAEVQVAHALIRSGQLLSRVVEKLDLAREWGRRFARGEDLSQRETMELLKQRIEVRSAGGLEAPILAIRCFSENPVEAAELANIVTENYVEYYAQQLRQATEAAVAQSPTDLVEAGEPRLYRVVVLDLATPPQRPFRPNRPLNIFLSGLAGLLLGGLTALITGLVTWARQARPVAPSSAGKDLFWRRVAMAGGVLLLILILVPVGLMLMALSLPAIRQARQQAQPAPTVPFISDYTRDNQLVISETQVHFTQPDPGQLDWAFKCFIPPEHVASFLFVRWADGVPSVDPGFSAYFKVGSAGGIDVSPCVVSCSRVLASPRHAQLTEIEQRKIMEAWRYPEAAGITQAVQWNVNLGVGSTSSSLLPMPPLRRRGLSLPQRVPSGHQLSFPLVEYDWPEGAENRGQSGVELRVLLEPLRAPLIKTAPGETVHTNYISGSGLVGTVEEALARLNNLPH